MKKLVHQCLCSVMILLFLFMGGCSASPERSNSSAVTKANIPAGYAIHKILFPVDEKGKTKENASVYEIKPFGVSFVLPKNWSIKEAKSSSKNKGEPLYLYKGLYSVMDVFDGSKCVGAIGYNTYKLYKGAEDNPKAIFSEISLGSGYRFEVADNYKPVKTVGAAITDVYYSAAFLKGYGIKSGEKRNWGILSHNKKLLVYVAAEFDKNVVVKSQIDVIANSFRF